MTPPAANNPAFTVGFFGGGMMAEAIIRGLLAKSVLRPDEITVLEPVASRRAFLASDLGLNATADSRAMLSASDTVFLAVKPDIIPAALRDIAALEDAAPDAARLYVSIAAGVPLSTLCDARAPRRVARVMPNQPAVVGAGASAVSFSPACTGDDQAHVHTLLSAIGAAVSLPEKAMDAVTGLSGSGPAFVFMMIEAMADAGVKNGLPRAVAQKLAAQTVFGASKMLVDDPAAHPAVLRNRVESPGGTTIAGTAKLEEGGFRAAVISAVSAATARSAELGKQ